MMTPLYSAMVSIELEHLFGVGAHRRVTCYTVSHFIFSCFLREGYRELFRRESNTLSIALIEKTDITSYFFFKPLLGGSVVLLFKAALCLPINEAQRYVIAARVSTRNFANILRR